MAKRDASDRLVQAAFALFAERGYEGTTVDDIASRALTGRTTFFRHFGSKEDVIFPDHELLLSQVRTSLPSSSTRSALEGVCTAVGLVLDHYLRDANVSRLRYALTSSVPTLRERELVSGARYQRLFRDYLLSSGDPLFEDPLHAEVAASAVVAAHNQTLRRWLRRETTTPESDLSESLRYVRSVFAVTPVAHRRPRVLVAEIEAAEDVDSVLRRVERSLRSSTRKR